MLELLTADERNQAVLADAPFQKWALPDGTQWTQFYRTSRGYLFRFPNLADFEHDTGNGTTTCWPVPGVSQYTTRFLYESQIVPLLLSRHGALVLHASAIENAGLALAFVAETGRGKSTLAGSFLLAGWQILTDDGLVVSEEDDTCVVRPGLETIRPSEDSQQALSATGGEREFSREPCRLHRMYFLGKRDTDSVSIESLAPAEAMIEIVRHSFVLDPDERSFLSMHFEQLSRLVRLPIVFRLEYPRRFDALPAVRAAILLHCEA